MFFVNVPLALGCVLAAPRLLPADPSLTSGAFDVPGAVLATSGSALLVLGLATGPDSGWLSLRSTGALAAGIALLALLLLVEARSREPLIPLRLARSRNLAITMIVIAIFQATLGDQGLQVRHQPVTGGRVAARAAADQDRALLNLPLPPVQTDLHHRRELARSLEQLFVCFNLRHQPVPSRR